MIGTARRLRYLLGVLLVIVVAACGEVMPGSSSTSGDVMQGASSVRGHASTTMPATPAPAATRPGVPPPTPPGGIPAGHRDVGILDRHDGPFPGQLFGVANQYSGPYHGQWLMIYAGCDKDPSQIPDPCVHGAIRIMLSPVDPSTGNPTYIGEFAAPKSPTWVKVVAVAGSTLTLQREDGSKVTFDLNDYTFTPSAAAE